MSTGEPTDWRKAAFADYVERRRVKSEEFQNAKQQAERYVAIAKTREIELAELDKAVKVLGIVFEPEKPVDSETSKSSPPTTGEAPVFKELALEALRAVHPASMRAAQVQAEAERKAARKFHEKTAGMTLFRLSKDGLVRRSGWDWYYVPENERLPAEASTGINHEEPEHTPEAQKAEGSPMAH